MDETLAPGGSARSEGAFKYQDWYTGSGRSVKAAKPAKSLKVGGRGGPAQVEYVDRPMNPLPPVTHHDPCTALNKKEEPGFKSALQPRIIIMNVKKNKKNKLVSKMK